MLRDRRRPCRVITRRRSTKSIRRATPGGVVPMVGVGGMPGGGISEAGVERSYKGYRRAVEDEVLHGNSRICNTTYAEVRRMQCPRTKLPRTRVKVGILYSKQDCIIYSRLCVTIPIQKYTNFHWLIQMGLYRTVSIWRYDCIRPRCL